MLKILQARLQQYMNRVKLVLEKAEEPEIKLPTSIVQKNLYFFFIDYTKDLDCVDFDCVDQNKLWKILKEMGIPDHFPWILRNLYTH